VTLGIKEYLKKKKEGFDKYRERRDVKLSEKREREKIQLKLDAQAADKELAELKERDKHKKKIDELKRYKEKSDPGPFSSLSKSMDGAADSFGGFDLGFNNKKSDFFGSGGDIFGGDLFPAPKQSRKKHTKRKKKRKLR